MYKKVIEKMIEMCEGDQFGFYVREIDNEEIEYPVKVKCFSEFDSTLVMVGALGGGFNMVFLANDNMINRENEMMHDINQEFPKVLCDFKFVRFFE